MVEPFSVNAGDAFLLPDKHSVRHLHVVLSDPAKLPDVIFPEHVYVVMLSTMEDHKEAVCVLQADDHPFLTHPTVSVYRVPPALWMSLTQLRQLKAKDILIEKEPVSAEVLQRLQAGYSRSKYQMDRVTQFLFRQGIID